MKRTRLPRIAGSELSFLKRNFENQALGSSFGMGLAGTASCRLYDSSLWSRPRHINKDCAVQLTWQRLMIEAFTEQLEIALSFLPCL